MSAKKPIEEKIANIPPFGLRMLPELKDRIAQAAEASSRSMNAEIVARLEASIIEDEHNGDREILKLRLPRDVLTAAQISSLSYDQPLEDFVADAVKRATGHLSEYQSAFDEMEDLRQDLADAERISAARQALLDERERSMHLLETLHETETGLLFIQVNSFGAFIERLLKMGDAVPEDVREEAERHRQNVYAAIEALRSESHLDDAEKRQGDLKEDRARKERHRRRLREERLGSIVSGKDDES